VNHDLRERLKTGIFLVFSFAAFGYLGELKLLWAVIYGLLLFEFLCVLGVMRAMIGPLTLALSFCAIRFLQLFENFPVNFVTEGWLYLAVILLGIPLLFQKKMRAFGVLIVGYPLLTGGFLGGGTILENLHGSMLWLFLAFLLPTVWLTDSAAYLVGCRMRGPLLAPRLSPKKTWSGLAGGVFVGTVWAFSMLGIQGKLSWITSLWALALPWFAVAGDLFESWGKRLLGVKDSSDLLPGHGGMWDRLDSLIFVFCVLGLFQIFGSSIPYRWYIPT
jgi:phosphatidate cytidylyltransferase